MYKLFSYLDLGKIGLLELLFAMYPILAGYQYGLVHMDMLVALVMDIIAIIKPLRGKYFSFKPLLFCVIYAIVHEIFLVFIIDVKDDYFIKNIIQLIIISGSIFIIVPKLNYEKLIHSIMWVALFSSIGILYHFIELQNGHICHPIKLPFMPEMDNQTRLYENILRPTSFFWEPASYVTFMMFPFFIQLYSRKYILAFLLLFFILLSTSTNGIALGFIMLIAYVFTQKIKMQYRVLTLILGCFMLLFLLNSSLFESGVEKLNNTNFDNEVRLINGPNTIFSMNKAHWLFGFPNVNLDDYVRANPNVNTLVLNNGIIYLSTFWNIWAKYGIISLILYLYAYYKMVNGNKELFPYVFVLFIALFTQSITYSNYMFLFQMVCILVFIRFLSLKKQKESNLIL